MGRIDPGKGVSTAIELFSYLTKEAPEIRTRIYGYPWKHKPESKKLHEELLMQDEIFYEPINFEGYTQAVDENVRCILKETDVLFLPYDKLSSSVDTPLLLLEGMAHLCFVITKPLGNIPQIYGTTEWLLTDFSNPEMFRDFLMRIPPNLDQERKRLYAHCRDLQFQSPSVVNQFLSTIAFQCQ
jgi:glycosyltransferase involved in cell wall biosynthesis